MVEGRQETGPGRDGRRMLHTKRGQESFSPCLVPFVVP